MRRGDKTGLCGVPLLRKRSPLSARKWLPINVLAGVRTDRSKRAAPIEIGDHRLALLFKAISAEDLEEFFDDAEPVRRLAVSKRNHVSKPLTEAQASEVLRQGLAAVTRADPATGHVIGLEGLDHDDWTPGWDGEEDENT
jgi:hypothetical protein